MLAAMKDDSRPQPDPRTLAAQALGWEDEATGAVVPPVHFSTTFTRTPDDYGLRLDGSYIRDVSPTSAHAEAVIAALESAEKAICVGSGMAACSAAFHALSAGDHVVCARPCYHGVVAWLETFAERRGLGFTFATSGDVASIEAAIEPGRTKLVWLESPCNPTWAVTDIAEAAAVAHRAGALLGIDSTAATPVLTQPLTLGADIVVHSATKFLAGHSDVLAGALATNDPDHPIWQGIVAHRLYGGAMLGAMEAFLLTRGMRTLFLRVERQCANAQKVAEFLADHPRVEKVHYPGLPDDPGNAVAMRQMRGGFGGMLSFLVQGGREEAVATVLACKTWKAATSLGGVESLIEHRRTSEKHIRTATPENLIRLSTGIEHVDDLIADLEQALSV